MTKPIITLTINEKDISFEPNLTAYNGMINDMSMDNKVAPITTYLKRIVMASIITIAFEGWKAQEAASGKAVLLDEFVFANVPNLDPTKPIDRNEKLPPANQIVHRQAVNKAGLASENAVAYSVTLGAEIGDFDFNWIGLLNKASGTVAMITHAPTQKKLKTQNGQQGNVLTRSFILEFQGAAEETQIKTSAETWQIDFTARLSGIDEMQRLVNTDSYGVAAFFDDGFEVTRSAEQFTIKKGLAYVGGLRGLLEQNQILNGLRNTKVYADFSYQGNIVSQWRTVIKITAAATLNNYVDAAGFSHQVFAVASIDASGNVKDLRPLGALSDQELSALETRFKLDLSKKIDKANITHQTGNSTELVASQQMVTTELGKKQPVGNYAPLGDYATNLALNNGLALKLDKTGGVVRGNSDVLTLQNTVDSGSLYLKFTRKDGQARGWVGFGGAGNDISLNNNYSGKTLSLTSTGTLIYDGKEVMQIGNYGWGGYGEVVKYTETEMVDYVKAQSGRTRVFRNDLQATKISDQYATVAYFKAGDTFTAISAPYDGKAVSIVGGNHVNTFTHRLFSDRNTRIDRNGHLKASGEDALSDCPVGSPIPWPQTTAPSGFLVCNGQSFNKTTYPLLASAYPSGTLPDLRGEFIRGLDFGRNIDSGRAVLSSQSDAIRDITGTIQGVNVSGNGVFGDRELISTNATPHGGGKDQYSMTFKASNVVPTASENRPRNIAFLYIVRAA